MDTSKKIKNKIKEWFDRYFLSELLSYLFAMSLWWSTYYIFKNHYISGICIIIWDNIWYYLPILIKEIRLTYKKNKQYNIILFIKNIRNIWFEFWPSELLQFFLIYPFFLTVTPVFIKNYFVSSFIAMTLSIIFFYITTITFFELRKKIFKD